MAWFRRKRRSREPINAPTPFPSGLFVRVGRDVYYIKGKTKFKLYSSRVVDSWRPSYIIDAEPTALSKHILGSPLGFRNGTLIHNVADAKIYLISDNKRLHIMSPDVFDVFGLDRDDVIEVSDAEVRLHPEGEPLS